MSSVRGWVRDIAPYVFVILIAIGIRALFYGIIIFAQEAPITCPDKDTVVLFINTLRMVLMLAIIVIVLFVVFFNMLGFVSMIAMRLGEFFNEKLRFVFEMVMIYILFLWNLDENLIDEEDGCAVVDWETLFSEGPLFFRMIGWLLNLLGIGGP